MTSSYLKVTDVEFIGAMANAIYIGTYAKVRLITPLQWMMKVDIVRLGVKIGVEFDKTWSCYKGGTLHCGTCATCRSRRDAFQATGVDDPTRYECEPETEQANG